MNKLVQHSIAGKSDCCKTDETSKAIVATFQNNYCNTKRYLLQHGAVSRRELLLLRFATTSSITRRRRSPLRFTTTSLPVVGRRRGDAAGSGEGATGRGRGESGACLDLAGVGERAGWPPPALYPRCPHLLAAAAGLASMPSARARHSARRQPRRCAAGHVARLHVLLAAWLREMET
ncbi:hypothetical protein SEVIR_9G391650v4 [Setaria viridis]